MREKRSTCIRCGRKSKVSEMIPVKSWLKFNQWNANWYKYPRKDSKMCVKACSPYKGDNREQLLMF